MRRGEFQLLLTAGRADRYQAAQGRYTDNLPLKLLRFLVSTLSHSYTLKGASESCLDAFHFDLWPAGDTPHREVHRLRVKLAELLLCVEEKKKCISTINWFTRVDEILFFLIHTFKMY